MKASSEPCWNRKHRSVASDKQTISHLLRYSSLQTIQNGSPAKRCLSRVVCVNIGNPMSGVVQHNNCDVGRDELHLRGELVAKRFVAANRQHGHGQFCLRQVVRNLWPVVATKRNRPSRHACVQVANTLRCTLCDPLPGSNEFCPQRERSRNIRSKFLRSRPFTNFSGYSPLKRKCQVFGSL